MTEPKPETVTVSRDLHETYRRLALVFGWYFVISHIIDLVRDGGGWVAWTAFILVGLYMLVVSADALDDYRQRRTAEKARD